jgi:hypothetical protein
MKQLTITIALLALGLLGPQGVAGAGKKQTIEELVKKVAEAYLAKDLGRLDDERPYQRTVRIVVEHSLSEDEYDVRQVKTLKQGERWLKRREDEDGTPFREVRRLLHCKRGVCRYDLDGGISHNHLYFKKILYGYQNGTVFVKTIHLLDGD